MYQGLIRSANRILLTITHSKTTSRFFPKACLLAAIALIWLVLNAVNPVLLCISTPFSHNWSTVRVYVKLTLNIANYPSQCNTLPFRLEILDVTDDSKKI
jgi:hypothetical protein